MAGGLLPLEDFGWTCQNDVVFSWKESIDCSLRFLTALFFHNSAYAHKVFLPKVTIAAFSLLLHCHWKCYLIISALKEEQAEITGCQWEHPFIPSWQKQAILEGGPITHNPASLVEPNSLPSLSNWRSVTTVIRDIKAIKMSIQA